MSRRWVGALAAVFSAFVLAGCGGGGTGGGGGLDATLSYFPADPLAVAVVDTNLDGDQWKEIDRLVEQRTGKHVETYLRGAVDAGTDFSWDDVRPLLGKELVIGSVARGGANPSQFLFALHAKDGGKMRDLVAGSRLFTRIGEANGATLYSVQDGGLTVAVEGDVFLSASDEAALRAALARHDGEGHLTQARFDGALSDVPQNRLVRFYGAAATALQVKPLDRLTGLPWVDALTSFGGALGFEGHKGVGDIVLRTEPDRITDDDLPLAPGGPAPEVLHRDHEIVSANRNQSRTTTFLFRAAELAYPDSRFVRDVHRLEQRTGIDFVQEVLRQFDGPSASVVSLDGKTFAARSAVRDPERVEAIVREIAPDLPELVVGLQGLQSQGQALLFLFAPDAPVTIKGQGGVTVTPPSGPGGLWRVSGLQGEGPPQLWFGTVGDVFVVGSDEALARQVATEPTEPVPGAQGAADLRVNLSGLEEEVGNRAGINVESLGELVAWVDASRERIHARITLEFP